MMQQDRYLEAIDHCYGALDRPDGLQEFGAYLGALISADAGDIVSEWKDRPAIRTHFSFGFDPDFRMAYDDDFLGDNPWFDNLSRQAEGRFHTDAVDPLGYRDSDYFKEWVRPQGLDRTVGAVLQNDPEKHIWVGFVRATGRQGFDEETCFLNRLLPHIRRVVTAAEAAERAESYKAGVNALVDHIKTPLFLLDQFGKVDFVNAAGQQLLARNMVFRLSKTGKLCLRKPGLGARFARQVKAAIDLMSAPDLGDDDALIVESEQGEYVSINILPLRTGLGDSGSGSSVAIFVTDIARTQQIDIRAFAQLFKLTGTERQLAQWLGQGKAIVDFAAQSGMAVSTSRWHLRNLEAKTHTTRIEELVALIQNSQSILR